MKYIEQLNEGDRIQDVYLCKKAQSATTKTGKEYINVILSDKTGSVDAKIWDPSSGGIEDFDVLDYVDVVGDVTSFNNALQINIKRIRKCREGEYDPAEYLPVSEYNVEDMYKEVVSFVNSVKDQYLLALLTEIFIKDEKFVRAFKNCSAAKSVHHGFVGGLLQHTLAVTRLCDFYTQNYPMLNRDLLISAALCHDMGKVKELSAFPENDYTDEGQLLGHIVMGYEMIAQYAAKVADFPAKRLNELKHCILAHHGELEFGSPKKPALIEAVALNFADNTDAKMETLTELFKSTDESGWLGFQKYLDSNIRKTSK